MMSSECETILGHLMFHRSLIDDKAESQKSDRLEDYVKMVEQMQQGMYLISNDPFERSVAMAFELVIKNRMNPWELDLLEFSKMYLQKVKKAEDVNLMVAGKLIYMAWEVFKLQTEDLLGRIDKPEQNEMFFEGWDTDTIELYNDIDDPAGIVTIMQGSLELREAARRPTSERHVSLVELLDAFEEAKHEADVRAEISKYLEKYKPKDFDDKAHKETLEQDIANTWKRIQELGAGAIPFSDLCQSCLREDRVSVFMSILFLVLMEKITMWQEKLPYGEIFVEMAAQKNFASIRDDGKIIDLSSITSVDQAKESTVVK